MTLGSQVLVFHDISIILGCCHQDCS